MVQLTPNMPYITLRVKFVKRAELQYISHLDLVRTMHKIIARAGLPLWYTMGFNPKPKMIFAAPLSIGTESECEFVDIRLVDRPPEEEVLRRLNANMTENMRAVAAYYPETKLTDLKWLRYRIAVKTEGASEALAAACAEYLLGDEVLVKKKSRDKRSEEQPSVNIRSGIREITAGFDGECIILDAVLSADASAFLNPEYVVSALRGALGILSSGNLLDEYYSVLRTEAYREDMTPFN